MAQKLRFRFGVVQPWGDWPLLCFLSGTRRLAGGAAMNQVERVGPPLSSLPFHLINTLVTCSLPGAPVAGFRDTNSSFTQFPEENTFMVFNLSDILMTHGILSEGAPEPAMKERSGTAIAAARSSNVAAAIRIIMSSGRVDVGRLPHWQCFVMLEFIQPFQHSSKLVRGDHNSPDEVMGQPYLHH